MTRRRSLVAVDVGGTFTDVTLGDPDTGETWSIKCPTASDDPSTGFAQGIRLALDAAEREPESIELVLHATTVATNAVLESSGATTGLVTTRGFRHVLEIGRHDGPRRTSLLHWVKPERPIPPDRIGEVTERIDHDGTIRTPLDEADVRAAAAALRAAGVESVAVCLINAYRNGEHERRVRELLQIELPGVPISVSSEVLPVFREYERTMATALDATVRPVVARYLEALGGRLEAIGIRADVLVMQSNGGLEHAHAISRRPAWTVLSGPAASVIGALATAREVGIGDLIALDVGGTSTDVALVRGGAAELTDEGTVGPWPLAFPMIDIHTIGAGGGSIATTETGRLTVGPRSAGAHPGPASYDLGGVLPTVTDAQLVLGRLPERLAGGAISLHEQAAREAIRREVADPLGLDPVEAAWGIVELADHHIAAAIRLISTERGHDPRGHVLVAGGGAGPLHAANVAALLGLPAVLVPGRPGVLSTFGLLVGDLRREFVRTQVCSLADGPPVPLRRLAVQLEQEATAWFDSARVTPDRRVLAWSFAMRYAEQASELAIPWPDSGRSALGAGRLDGAAAERLMTAFHARHRDRYGYDLPGAPVEVVSIRLAAVGRTGVALPARSPATRAEAPRFGRESDSERPAYVGRSGGFVPARVADRRSLAAGELVLGPAILEQPDTTVWVPPDHRARADASGNLWLEREGPP